METSGGIWDALGYPRHLSTRVWCQRHGSSGDTRAPIAWRPEARQNAPGHLRCNCLHILRQEKQARIPHTDITKTWLKFPKIQRFLSESCPFPFYNHTESSVTSSVVAAYAAAEARWILTKLTNYKVIYPHNNVHSL